MAAGKGQGRGRRPELVKNARRGGPPRAFWIALGLIAVIGLGVLAWSASQPKTRVTRLDPSLPALKAEGYVLGSPSAPVEVIEFADFECPACGQYTTVTEPDVRAKLVNTGKVRIRFMDFPLPMHKNTWDASLAASCANDQGKFWEMHDVLFANQDRWGGEATSRPRPVISDLAKGLGLDMTKYGACMDNETHRPQIQATLAEAERRQINSTPSFVFNGTVVANALPYDQFRKYVDDATAAAASAPKADARATVPAGKAPGTPPAAPTGKRP
jgi:protein-disulfide isomerase